MIQHMWDQEKHHLATFDKLIPEHRVRPTALLPFWNVAGFALGAGTEYPKEVQDCLDDARELNGIHIFSGLHSP